MKKYRFEIFVGKEMVGSTTDLLEAEKMADEIAAEYGVSVEDLIIAVR